MQHADIRFPGSILMRKYFDSAKQKQSSLGQLYREMTGVSTLQSHFKEFRSVSISSYLKV